MNVQHLCCHMMGMDWSNNERMENLKKKIKKGNKIYSFVIRRLRYEQVLFSSQYLSGDFSPSSKPGNNHFSGLTGIYWIVWDVVCCKDGQ